MKKLQLLFIGLAIFAIGTFTSCEDDDTTPLAPSIEFIAGEDYLTGDQTVNDTTSYSFKWNVTKGTADLEEFTVRLDNIDLTGFPKTDIDKELYQAEVTEGPKEEGVYEYTFIATDKDGMTATETITVTVEPTAGAIVSYTDKILGSYEANEGSSFASIDGTIYNSADAATNSEKVDFVYYYGQTNLAVLGAPNDTEVQTVYPGVANWTTQNATVFGTTTLNADGFDAIEDDAEIVDAAADLAETKATELAVGDVIAFETAETSANASKKGLIRVVAINGTLGTSTIEIEVKVQE